MTQKQFYVCLTILVAVGCIAVLWVLSFVLILISCMLTVGLSCKIDAILLFYTILVTYHKILD